MSREAHVIYLVLLITFLGGTLTVLGLHGLGLAITIVAFVMAMLAI